MTTTNEQSDDDRIVSRTRLVPATAQDIFDLLADPAAHATFDGSDTVQSSRDENPERLELGSKFGMKMQFGVPYRITNTVVEFDEPTLIAWRHFGGHVWRYLLDGVDGGTEVTEQFDWGRSHAPWLLQLAGYPKRHEHSLDATLQRLVDHFEGTDGPAEQG